MSLEHASLARAVAAHGRIVRVVVAEVRGSAPREPGAAMLVWPDGQSGTIGGGTLEFDALAEAREMLATGQVRQFIRARLGPDLGQCCGGAVALLFEAWTAGAVARLGEGLHARPVEDETEAPAPLAVERLRAQARASGARPRPRLVEGWFIEPVSPPRTPVWIWGAGHVGRALVATLAPHPDLALTWVDTAAERFPGEVPEGVAILPSPEIVSAVRQAPATAHHLVLTYSHALDLALCNALLARGFATAGVIGSATKWARFRARLGQMGHGADAIARIRCPIGEKGLGKHPQAIAVGVACGLLREMAQEEAESPAPGDMGDSDDRRALEA